MDPNKNAGEIQHDGSPVEFGNTPSGGKFAAPWSLHGWTADPLHRGDSGFKIKDQSVYATATATATATASSGTMEYMDEARRARIEKEKCKCSDDKEEE